MFNLPLDVDCPQINEIIENKEGYAYYQANLGPELEGKPNNRPRHTAIVEFITDQVPGAFYDPMDTIKVLASHSYVATVSMQLDDGRPMATDIFISKAIEQVDDHYDLREALKAWNEGAWDDALSYLTEQKD